MKIRFPFRFVKALPLLACLSSAPATAQINVTVNAGTSVATIPSAIYGNNAQFYNAHNNGADATYNTAMQASGCRNIRWPGGSEADQTNWNNVVCWDGGAATTPQFITFLQDIGGTMQPIVNASGIWCNGGSGSASPTTFTYAAAVSLAEAWVTWNKSNAGSAKATYWEVGNEIYGNWEVGGQGTANVNMSGTVYGQNFANFYTGMKAIDSTIKIGAVASPGSGDYTNWTPNMLKAAKSAGVVPDFLIIHNYPVSQGAPAGTATDKYLLSFPATVATQTSSLNSIVSSALGSSYVGQVKYFMTEYNCCLGPDAQVNEYVNAMFCSEWLLECAKNGWIGANLWATENGGTPDYGFLNSSTDAPFPNYYVYPMLSGKFGTNMISCTSSNPMTVSSYAALDSSNDLTLFAVNNNPTASQSVTFSISGFNPSSTGKAWVMLPAGTGSSGVSQEATVISINGNDNPSPNSVSGIAGKSQAASSSFIVTLQPSEMYLLVIPASSASNPTSTFTPTATRTPTMTNTLTATRSNTPTLTPTLTATSTATKTATNSFTATRTNTPKLTPTSTATSTSTPTATSTVTRTDTPANTPTASPATTPTRTATSTATNTYTKSFTATRTNSPTPTESNSPTASMTPSPTPSRTATPTATNTSVNTATSTATNSQTVSRTPTASLTATGTASFTATLTSSKSPTGTATSTRTSKFTATSTATYSATATTTNSPTFTVTATPTISATRTDTPSATFTATASPTPTSTATQADTPTRTISATSTDTLTVTSTPTNAQTGTLPPTNTPTNTATVTDSFTATHTVTSTPTLTPTLAATSTDISTSTMTETNTGTATATETRTHSPTNTATASFTMTDSMTPSVTASSTSSPSPSRTPTASMTATGTASLTASRSATSTATLTASSTPSNLFTFTPSFTVTPFSTPLPNPTPVVFPNPAMGPTVVLKIPATTALAVRVEIFTTAFRKVQDESLPVNPGYWLSLNLVDEWGRSLANGLYYVVVNENGQKMILKLLIEK